MREVINLIFLEGNSRRLNGIDIVLTDYSLVFETVLFLEPRLELRRESFYILLPFNVSLESTTYLIAALI